MTDPSQTNLDPAHIEPIRKEIWIGSKSSFQENLNSTQETGHSNNARNFLAKAENSQDYGGFSDYEEPNPPEPAFKNMPRESTGKSIYENMYS